MNPDINMFPLPNTTVEATGHVKKPDSITTGMAQQPMPAKVQAQSRTSIGDVAHVSGAGGVVPKVLATESEVDFEKRWVAKVKAIIVQTKYDPYMQSSELSRVGKEYRKELQQRGHSIK